MAIRNYPTQSAEVIQTPAHRDYEKNLSYANKFIDHYKDKMPAGVKIGFDTTMHSPRRQMMIFSFRLREPKMSPRGVMTNTVKASSYATHLRLDEDTHAQVVKNIQALYKTYCDLSLKYETKIPEFA